MTDERATPPPELGDSPQPTQPTDQPLAIPDGGLGEAMPDWLQRPPAWREPARAASGPRALPPPDTTPIDPRTMLDIGDLPLWLQRIAARAAGHGQTGGEPVTPPDPDGERAGMPDDAVPAEPEPPSSRPAAPEIVLLPPPRPSEPQWWRSRVGLGGVAAIVLLIVIWVVLVAI